MFKKKSDRTNSRNRQLLDSLNIRPFSRRPPAGQSLFRLNALVSLWIILTCNIPFFSRVYELTAYHGFKRALFMGGTALVLWAYLFILLTVVTGGRRLAQVLLSLVLLVSAQTAYFCMTYGVGIDPGQVQNMLETDPKEVQALLSPRMVAMVLGILLPGLFLIWRQQIRRQTLVRTLVSKLAAVLLAILVSLPVALSFYGTYAPMFRENRQLRDYITPQNFLSSLYRHYHKNRPAQQLPFKQYGTDARKTDTPAPPRLLVLVVGETARAQSFGLNGYARNTTPALEARQVTNYRDTSSCGTATAVSLPCMFSGMTREQYDEPIAKSREGLLDILKRAGYAVTWVDNNSGCKGTCDRVEVLELPQKQYPELCTQDLCWDEILLKATQNYLKTAPVQDRVLVLHQAGSHGPAYYARYPASARRFTPACDTNEIQKCDQTSLINTYDNTIAYTDQNLGQLIDYLKQDRRYQSSMLYVSDHGESTGEKGLYLHGAPYMFAPVQQTQVPMVYWFSDGYKKQQPKVVQCIQQNSTRPASHDNYFPTVLGMAGVKTSVKNQALDLSVCQPGSS